MLLRLSFFAPRPPLVRVQAVSGHLGVYIGLRKQKHGEERERGLSRRAFWYTYPSSMASRFGIANRLNGRCAHHRFISKIASDLSRGGGAPMILTNDVDVAREHCSNCGNCRVQMNTALFIFEIVYCRSSLWLGED